MKKLKEKGPSLKERIKNKIPRIYFCFKTNKSKVGKAAFVIVPLVVAAVGAGVGIYFGEKGKRGRRCAPDLWWHGMSYHTPT